ncbi:MAG: hypothetical protein EXQ70_04580 [Solirubrobacterales bacterium]|nr:hypothetical protein [Solirubrobacterales bacterium]
MIFTLVGAVLIGFGVPLLWIWIASQFYDKAGAVTGSVALFIGMGILVSYWIILLLASWVRMHLAAPQRTVPRRSSWNRSMRDAPQNSERSDPVERLFVATAVISIIGFAIWFAFFAGAPLPSSPGI